MPSPLALFRLAITAVVILPALTLAYVPPTPTRRDPLAINPPANNLASLIGAPAPRSINTNANRLARGLNPLPPRSIAARRSQLTKAARHDPNEKRSTPSGTPCLARSGYIEVLDAVSGSPLGYVADDVNQFGEYVITQQPSLSLTISFQQCGTTGVVGPFDVEQTNTCGCMPYPNLGGIQGYSSTSGDLGPGSYNYLYLGGVSQTGPMSTCVNAANSFTQTTRIAKCDESRIWYLDTSTSLLTWGWVDSDSIGIQVLFVRYNYIILAIGDPRVFQAQFGSVPQIFLRFVDGSAN